MQLQVKTILNAIQHFPGFVFQDIRLQRHRDGRPRRIEIALDPHGGIPAKCSRCLQPAPGYHRVAGRADEAIVNRKHDQVIFETVLAAERLENIEIEHLRSSGELRLEDDDSSAIGRAMKRLSDTARHFTNGTHSTILERWEAMYVSVLFMSLEDIQMHGAERTPKKVKALSRFMDR